MPRNRLCLQCNNVYRDEDMGDDHLNSMTNRATGKTTKIDDDKEWDVPLDADTCIFCLLGLDPG